MVSQAEPACEESVPPVEPNALQMVGLQDPPDQAIGLVHNAPDEALTANNLNQEKQCFGPPGSGSFYYKAKIVRNLSSYCFVLNQENFGICVFT